MQARARTLRVAKIKLWGNNMDNKGCCAMPASCETGDKSETKKGGCGPKKGCCGAMIKGALVGGVVAFL